MPSNERQFVTALMKRAKQEFRGSVVLKHADRFTRNIPDVQICWADKSWWVEAKHLRKGRRLKDIVEKGQLLFGHELAVVTNGRAVIVVLNDVDCRVEVWTPRALFLHLYPALAAGVPATAGSKAAPGLPFSPDNHELDAMNMLKTAGMLWFPGDSVDLPMRILHSGFTRC